MSDSLLLAFRIHVDGVTKLLQRYLDSGPARAANQKAALTAAGSCGPVLKSIPQMLT